MLIIVLHLYVTRNLLNMVVMLVTVILCVIICPHGIMTGTLQNRNKNFPLIESNVLHNRNAYI